MPVLRRSNFTVPGPTRYHAASIVEGEKLWITGGLGGGTISSTDSTEYIFSDGRNELGPPMPLGLMGHAMVRINDTTSFLVGGYFYDWDHDYGVYSNRTWFYDGSNWIEGPNLQKGRELHSAGTIVDPFTDQVYVVVAGGSRDNEHGRPEEMNDVEILNLQENKWESGNLL